LVDHPLMYIQVNSRKTTHTIIEEALAFENENKPQQYEEIPSKNIQMMRFGHTGLIEHLRAMLDSSVVSEITVPEHQDMRYINDTSHV
jgi:hypothetical protein